MSAERMSDEEVGRIAREAYAPGSKWDRLHPDIKARFIAMGVAVRDAVAGQAALPEAPQDQT